MTDVCLKEAKSWRTCLEATVLSSKPLHPCASEELTFVACVNTWRKEEGHAATKVYPSPPQCNRFLYNWEQCTKNLMDRTKWTDFDKKGSECAFLMEAAKTCSRTMFFADF